MGTADRVNLGLIPSSEAGWSVACAALNPRTGGVLHVHGNVTSYDVTRGNVTSHDTPRRNGTSHDVTSPGLKTREDSDARSSTAASRYMASDTASSAEVKYCADEVGIAVSDAMETTSESTSKASFRESDNLCSAALNRLPASIPDSVKESDQFCDAASDEAKTSTAETNMESFTDIDKLCSGDAVDGFRASAAKKSSPEMVSAGSAAQSEEPASAAEGKTDLEAPSVGSVADRQSSSGMRSHDQTSCNSMLSRDENSGSDTGSCDQTSRTSGALSRDQTGNSAVPRGPTGNSAVSRVELRAAWLEWSEHVTGSLRCILERLHHVAWTCTAQHVEHVKSYAPHVDHLVLDVHCAPVHK